MGCICSGEKKEGQYVQTKANFKHLRDTYLIDNQVLGQGTFGTVYKGTNRKNKNLEIAIKAIDKRKLDKEEIKGIHQEIQVLNKMDHSNTINYFETYEDKSFVYLCMELCTGGELIEDLTSKMTKYSETEAASIMYDLLSALNYMHSKNMMHRDIKPENIMFDKKDGNSRTAKFIDFGLACQCKAG